MQDMIIGPDSGAPFFIIMVLAAAIIIMVIAIYNRVTRHATKTATIYTYVPRVRVYPAPYDWASPVESMDYDTLMVDCPADPYHVINPMIRQYAEKSGILCGDCFNDPCTCKTNNKENN